MKLSVLFASIAFLLLSGLTGTRKDSSESVVKKMRGNFEAASAQHSEHAIPPSAMYPKLTTYISSILPEMEAITAERKKQLKKIALFIRTKKQSNEPANLMFICTHNSRRSHMSQLWAATAAEYYGIEGTISTFSGGTEVTAFNSRAVAALERAGFEVENPGGSNPRYKVTYGEKGPVMECFSKKYDDPSNVNENFVAIMTCSEADKNCPFIPGASLRVPIPYVDPKESDGSKEESDVYDERCRQIATEMFYIMAQTRG